MQMIWILRKLFIRSDKRKTKLFRRMGVRIGDNCSYIGWPDWDSEPYLITIGSHVRITYDVRFVTHDGGVHVLRGLYPEWERADLFGRITVGNNVFIGTRCTILPGVTIGDNVVIGANSVVVKDIPSNCVVAGVPARWIESVEDYRHKNQERIVPTKGMTQAQKREYLLKSFK